MASDAQDVIRLWLETNFAEATAKGGDALKALRDQVTAMGPEVAAVYDQMAGSEVKVAEATVEVAQEQGRLVQGMLALEERFELQAETTRVVAFETKELVKAEQLLDINTKALGRSFFDLERAGMALASGSGLGRIGPVLERLIGGAGGPAGIGFGIAGLALAFEVIGPKLEKFWGSWDGSAKAAKDVEELIARVQKLQALKGDDASTAFKDYLPGEDIAGRAAGAIGASGLSAQATSAEIEATKPQYMSTQAGPVLINDPEKAKKAMTDRIAASNLQLAAEQVDKAAKPGEAGKRARAFLKGLARGNPGAFPEGFADWLESIEETPQEREQAEADIEANDPDQQYMERRHAAREQHNAEAETFNKGLEEEKKAKAEKKRADAQIDRDAEAAQRIGEQGTAEKKRADAQIDRDAEAAQRIGEQGTRAARREQAKFAKEHTPEAMFRHQRHAQDNQIMGQVAAVNEANVSQGGQPASPEFMHQVANKAAQNVTMGADLASAVQIAIAQVQQKIGEDFRRGMARQTIHSQSFYSP